MSAPQSLKELVIHLSSHPRVTVQMQELPPSVRVFQGFAQGKLQWTDEHGRHTFTPLSCQHTGSETALRFTPTGFVVEKFNVEMVFTYAD